MNKLAVCIASYNMGKFLPELLESLKQQTFQDFKIYISYDGSNDNTKNILEEYKETIICPYENISGCGRNKNKVVTRALEDKPDYIQMIDADDKVLPRFLEAGVKRLEQGDVDFVVCWGNLFGDRTGYIHSQIPTLNELYINNDKLHAWGMFRRELFENHNFNVNLVSGVDWELWIRLIRDGYKGAIIKEELYLKRWHNTSITKTDRKTHEELRQEVLKASRLKENMNKKFTFHLLGLVHLPVAKKYCSCAFTQKIRKLAKMLLDKGHTVFLYGTGYTDIEHENLHFIQCATLSDVRKEWGEGDNRFELGYDISRGFRHDINKPVSECQKKFNANAIKNINLNKKPDHFLLLSQGSYQKSIADNVDLYLITEFGIGYRGSYCKFRAFESNYIRNFTYGSENPRQSINGRYYDRTIFNYFETELFTFNNKPEDYLCYLGRIIPRKGVETAMRVADILGMKLKIAGQGSLNDISYKCKNVDFVGTVDDKQRDILLRNAKALFLPTIYLEPFGGTSIEANFTGTPSITTNFGVFPETIINGLNGYRCDTLQDFVDNTKKSFDLDRKKIREYAVNNFSTEVINEQFEKWWQDLYQVYLSTTNKNIKGWHYIKDI